VEGGRASPPTDGREIMFRCWVLLEDGGEVKPFVDRDARRVGSAGGGMRSESGERDFALGTAAVVAGVDVRLNAGVEFVVVSFIKLAEVPPDRWILFGRGKGGGASSSSSSLISASFPTSGPASDAGGDGSATFISKLGVELGVGPVVVPGAGWLTSGARSQLRSWEGMVPSRVS
jgi:hypothetical protein